jgi:hypothetical protein
MAAASKRDRQGNRMKVGEPSFRQDAGTAAGWPLDRVSCDCLGAIDWVGGDAPTFARPDMKKPPDPEEKAILGDWHVITYPTA